MTWNVETAEYGVLPLFNDSRAKEYDTDVYRDQCFNALRAFDTDVCGQRKNNYLNENSTQILIRGTSSLWYYPENEISFRAEYSVVVDVWNYNIYWRNLILEGILYSSMIFFLFFIKACIALKAQ